jgi:hypothetical protein
MNFDPLFNGKKLSIYKKQINKVYVELNSASNNNKIILYFFKYRKFSLRTGQFFGFFETQS